VNIVDATMHLVRFIDAYHDAIPLNRCGSEDEIANMIVFLCSDKASCVTGQNVAVHSVGR